MGIISPSVLSADFICPGDELKIEEKALAEPFVAGSAIFTPLIK